MKQRTLSYLLAIGFILGLKNGYLTLWENGNTVEVYPYQAKFLPLSDQKLLKNGIIIHSETELAQILEDYLS